MITPDYDGPSVFGYETDVLTRVAAISAHTSPLASLGGKDAGGMNVYVRELSYHIAKQGLPIDIFTRRTDLETPEITYPSDGVRVISIAAGPPAPVSKHDLFQYMPEFAEQMALFALRDGTHYDIVHAHYWLSGFAAHYLKRYWNIPFTMMFHTTAHMKNAFSPAEHHEPEFRERMERRLVTLADSIIAGNPDERADLIWRQRANPEKICTIPPGVDTDLFRPTDQVQARGRLGLDLDDAVITFVGRIDPIKGIDTLLESVARTRELVPDRRIVLQLIGGDLDVAGNPVGPLAETAAQVQRLGIEANVRLLGSRPQDQLPLFYAASDLVCVPSRYESFGLVAVEAMACGRPVVASRSGGLIFSVADGISGYLAPVNDAEAFATAMARILNDRTLAGEMGRAARHQAERFAWPVVAESMHHVYLRLAQGHRAQLCCEDEIFA
ncbi:MAG: glycosyltransferase [Thermomicrobiales bacterium]|nr:glycosyltransferase [Thermomicrobiales bacterium]